MHDLIRWGLEPKETDFLSIDRSEADQECPQHESLGFINKWPMLRPLVTYLTHRRGLKDLDLTQLT